jgi:hypothetical protein
VRALDKVVGRDYVRIDHILMAAIALGTAAWLSYEEVASVAQAARRAVTLTSGVTNAFSRVHEPGLVAAPHLIVVAAEIALAVVAGYALAKILTVLSGMIRSIANRLRLSDRGRIADGRYAVKAPHLRDAPELPHHRIQGSTTLIGQGRSARLREDGP